MENNDVNNGQVSSKIEAATFGMGCFWCTEAIFQNLKGVDNVTSGYAGGTIKNPAYREVCTGRTGHAEVSQIIYYPDEISYEDLLEVFWQSHDPTTLNRQGGDKGTQYRSVIFYHNEEQKKLAEEFRQRLDAAQAFDRPIVTEISPLPEFYKAEDYHQQYFDQNTKAPYCQFVIAPKINKLKKVFKEKLKA
ncbi:MAG: peptide-methionine (S)-S-oxide reductase MsrA [Chitinophagales bacterium]|nr:peptide-methionine (S)-S-oxide reductase MsrA [Chitinophagales bacterium]